MTEQIYLPILKGKKGEYDALSKLTDNVKKKILPLIEIPAIAWDFVNEAPSTTLEKQVDSSIKSIEKSWEKDLPILIDTFYLDDDYNGTDTTIGFIINKLKADGYNPIPVFNPNSSKRAIEQNKNNETFCIRITFEELDSFDANLEIERVAKILKIDKSKIILLLDLGYIEEKQYVLAKRMSLSFYKEIKDIEKFKDFYFSATSFPINLSSCKTNSITEIERIEFEVHEAFKNSKDKLPRIPKFSDYCISNPETDEIDPRFMTISASIRYTYNEKWYIFKGGSIKKFSSDQFYSLSKEVVNSPIYSGEKFSWGDGQIYDKSKRIGGPGNSTTWRQINTNHHITLMVDLLSS
ncbi:beta family protein [Elizabethkingia anophelis]|uniref:beta family protein n=1 Tax=Elizabethkingia anophelis TaxID=1117645 RepID=UPI0012B364BF|nr:beta family protein [Elizabethkingia anophelis]MCT4086696.1 beta family protein [Elizabethkingia anophelis]MCT4104478.1 beta family protein [Elizabethkingia anophelis]QGN24588.1 hypothetical protein GJV56_18695 [Elizabethkingia anophelis]QNV11230.1 hypothetical protein EIY88_18665 [Elizabethkingia anophelis]UTF89381.1 beta family protein [Elizabethkingia anophelis]